MRRARLLLADDHHIVLAGLRLVLDLPDLEIVGSVNDGRALIAAAADLRPDVIVTDIGMPLLNGVEAARQIRLADKDVKIVFLTMHQDIGYVTTGLSLGHCGYVLKTALCAELPTAIRDALRGIPYISQAIREGLMLAQRPSSLKEPAAADRLTFRQREVLQLIAEGRTAKAIAFELKLSRKTVEFHKKRIKLQLGLGSTAEMARYAVKTGLIG